MMIKVFLSLFAVAVLIIFIVVTDGRYFGKRLTYWLYDQFGAAMFGSRSEATRWRQLAGALALRGDETILDLGTAVGGLPLTIAAQPNFHGQVIGVDWSPKMMAVARLGAQRLGLNGRTAFSIIDARQPLPFRSDEFDVIICLELLETLPHPEQVLSEMARILKPGGTLVLSLYRGILSLLAALSLDWYQKQLEPQGFKLQMIELSRNYDIVMAGPPGRKRTGLKNSAD